MCSYQRVNQTFACENSKLINGIIKGELDFQGAQPSYEGPTQSHGGSNQAP
jgi:beta-glucosidase-like glycosyl hydrolase